MLKIGLVTQVRYEYFDWDDRSAEPAPGGDLSGFSVPHEALILSAEAACDTRMFAVLDFGHFGPPSLNGTFENSFLAQSFSSSFGASGGAGSDVKEVWIEHTFCPEVTLRMGHLKTATTRQMMTSVPFQQFVDVSLASSYVSTFMPGYTERNRDTGVMAYGSFGCRDEWSWLATVTNGDTPPGQFRRNVLDGATDDNLAYSARVNWDILGSKDPESLLYSGMGYREGALLQHECEWTAAVGAWAYAYDDMLQDNPHTKFANRRLYGVDAAVGWGGLSLTAAWSHVQFDETDLAPTAVNAFEGDSWLVQVGYLFPGSAWEIAARWDGYTHEADTGSEFGATEVGVAVNYYLDGIRDKLSVDASFIAAEDDGNPQADVMAGYNPTYASDAMLIRFQWQLVL